MEELTAVSPIDGRYRKESQPLSSYFSEFAYIKFRLEVEVKYLIAISDLGIIRKLNSKEKTYLIELCKRFDLKECKKVKKIEEKTKHDLKSIEYYLRDILLKTSLKDVSEFIHFGLTSEDVNNIAIRLMILNANENVIFRSLEDLNYELNFLSKKYKSLVILGRTHGQPAVPTTLGKEFKVFESRLSKEIEILKKIKLTGKLNGAVGNYNGLHFSYPKINWPKFSKIFLSSLQLEPNLITNQINPPEDILFYFQTIQRINGIVLDLNQDVWRYISDNWLIQENIKGEVGSSTMPQKINPILFENSEGNLIMANSLIHGFVDKLPISRLQRDLSGSTISRNFGSALAYSLIAWQNTFRGLKKLKANEEQIEKDLNEDWSILSEALQIYLKKEGIKNGYELVKEKFRGKKLNKADWQRIVEELSLSGDQKAKLKKLSPNEYVD